MVTRKEEKNNLFLPPGRPSRRLPGRTGSSEPIPHALPAQTRSWSGPARHRPWPAGFAHTQRSRSRARASWLHPPSRPEPRDQMAKFRAGLGPARLSVPRPPVPAWPALARALPPGPWAPGSWTVPTWSLLTPGGHGSAAGAQAGSAEERPRRARGGSSPERTPARTRARPWGGGSQRGHASRVPDTWPRRTQWPRGPAAGRGDADSGRPALGGARRPASPAPGQPTGSSGRWGRAGRSAATPGGAFVPEGVERAVRVYVSLPSPGFLM